VSDVPVSEWRLLEIERLLRTVPDAETCAKILEFSLEFHDLFTKMDVRVDMLEWSDKDLKSALDRTRELVEELRRTQERGSKLDRHMIGYSDDRSTYSAPWMLRHYGLLDEDEGGT
jgi:hypothetical protein